MLVSEYDLFVQSTDKTVGKSQKERFEIAIFGLAAEIGSVIAAIKKRLLADEKPEDWNVANEEIVEELGDVVWYCFALARIANAPKLVNIFLHDIISLKREIGGNDDHARRIRHVLDPDKRAEFLKAAESFPTRTRTMQFKDYQELAFLTARTRDRTLVEVCLAVLSQLSAELFRQMLPEVELGINRAVADRPVNDILAGIAWHVAALASTYRVSLSDVARENMRKNAQRYNKSAPTPLHDIGYPENEQFPRRFEVAVVSIGSGRARMYWDGKRLGDDLTDNASVDDGYRFHDVMHLANIAMLGWSPVFRSLMRRKRKSNPTIDEIQDGARAAIVEEALIKAIHSEGLRQAKQRTPGYGPEQLRLFLNDSEISNRFVDFIKDLVEGLEVEKNQTWEWIEAIVQGYDIFRQIRREKQGTIIIDLDARSIKFRPEVGVTVAGKDIGLGSALLTVPQSREVGDTQLRDQNVKSRESVAKLAIADALGVKVTPEFLALFSVKEFDDGMVSVKASGVFQEIIWDRRVVTFKIKIREENERLYCTAIAVSDE